MKVLKYLIVIVEYSMQPAKQDTKTCSLELAKEFVAIMLQGGF